MPVAKPDAASAWNKQRSTSSVGSLPIAGRFPSLHVLGPKLGKRVAPSSKMRTLCLSQKQTECRGERGKGGRGEEGKVGERGRPRTTARPLYMLVGHRRARPLVRRAHRPAHRAALPGWAAGAAKDSDGQLAASMAQRRAPRATRSSACPLRWHQTACLPPDRVWSTRRCDVAQRAGSVAAAQ